MAALREVESLLDGFRTAPSSDVIVAGKSSEVFNYSEHPLLAASHKFVEAEQDLRNASRRVETAERELSEARDELSAKSELFDQQKTKLAELLK